ncbi:hypothetical protein GPECTOR_18g180 [Gonium pectorale]|uniref:phytol kinase n=1 Tax=Gonium pectorale TaxID=33097 RepID=A0A150GJN0_GONPE|nr:hypothetical protein GPECTOR_18g180 [Gonium pectorale]|eukprot:KXZ50028.1 hypothetical protein GPECTOR_18g180 [Gonium pectorale]
MKNVWGPQPEPDQEVCKALCGPACLPFMGLLAASLRLSPHELTGEGLRRELCCNIAYTSVSSVICLLLPTDPSAGYLPRFLLALLRGDTLHAAGRQLAALAGSPEAAADTAAAAAAEQGVLPVVSAIKYGANVLELVYRLTTAASKACLASQAPEALQLREELVAALEGSQVLEHAGRALLLLPLRVPHVPADSLGEAACAANDAYLRVVHLQTACAGHGPSEAFADRLRAVASGRCAQHAALCLSLAVLCDADGGPSHGMPPELLAALPTEVGYHAPDSRSMSTPAATQLRAMVSVLRQVGTMPRGRRASLALHLRVGWLAVASARELTAADRGSSGGSGVGGLAAAVPRRIVAAEDVFIVAMDALVYSWPFLPRPAGMPEREPHRVAEAAGWWRLAAAIAADVLPYANADELLEDLGQNLDLPVGRLLVCHCALSLPPEPPLEVAAALDGGLLRCLERLLRRAGRAPGGPEAAVVRALGCLGSFWSYLMPLLAYGEPRQAAALVATLRKLLRTVGPRAMLAEWAEWVSRDSNHDGLLQAVFDILTEAPLLDVSGAAPGEGPSPASQQLLRLLSCAVCELLPELTRAVLSEEASEALGAAVPIPVLMWLQLLAARCASQPGTPASSPPAHETAGGAEAISCAAAEPGGEAATADGGGWQALLLEEVGAVPLLDAALRRLVLPPSGVVEDLRGPDLRCLRSSCCAVAAVYMGPGPPAADTAPDTGCPGQSAPDGSAASAVVLDLRKTEAAAMGLEFAAPAGHAGPTAPAAAGAASARSPLPWRPELVREAATKLRAFGDHDAAAKTEALAGHLEQGDGGTCEALQGALREAWPLAAALPPPAEARRLLPGRCANPACSNLEGDSEADLALKSCAGCGAVGYCCRPCQLEHWRAGHKEACGRARGGGA